MIKEPMTSKQAYRADGGDISTDRIKEIANNVYGDEEKRWLAKRMLALLDELEAAEKRIAELQVREVKLPQRHSMLCRTDFNEDYSSHMAFKEADVIEAIRAAGIRINEEG